MTFFCSMIVQIGGGKGGGARYRRMHEKRVTRPPMMANGDEACFLLCGVDQ